MLAILESALAVAVILAVLAVLHFLWRAAELDD
jgi:hypothetical protein